ncbi:somatomedin-B and thrombospondin type-1 domain-containing protein-like isoform X1 [Pleurodeles waltl]|uniref:somatomedin-B and thrombospondin type-1 domain-containing protein-like isoform X1 n=1 Tax=Pleurodeles waltl TaxID=8319 RepID=UPI003709A0C7
MPGPARTISFLLSCGGLLWAAGYPTGAAGGCTHRQDPKCCPGRNNDCRPFTGQDRPCYCDTYCRKTGDCCQDYEAVCQTLAAVHCGVGPWGPWGQCSSLCGIGSRERARQVTVPPRNGGAPCPDLRQRRGCHGDNPICQTAKEVAKILPDSFKRDFKDPWRRPHMLLQDTQARYCVYFRLKQVGPACRLQSWTSQLVRERRICMECQVHAMGRRGRCEGDGLESARTFWTSASVPGCQGSWVRESLQEDCACPPYSYLFV